MIWVRSNSSIPHMFYWKTISAVTPQLCLAMPSNCLQWWPYGVVFWLLFFFYTTDSPRFAMPLPLQVLRSYIYKVRHDIAKHVNVRLKSTRYHLCKEKKQQSGWIQKKMRPYRRFSGMCPALNMQIFVQFYSATAAALWNDLN